MVVFVNCLTFVIWHDFSLFSLVSIFELMLYCFSKTETLKMHRPQDPLNLDSLWQKGGRKGGTAHFGGGGSALPPLLGTLKQGLLGNQSTCLRQHKVEGHSLPSNPPTPTLSLSLKTQPRGLADSARLLPLGRWPSLDHPSLI